MPYRCGTLRISIPRRARCADRRNGDIGLLTVDGLQIIEVDERPPMRVYFRWEAGSTN